MLPNPGTESPLHRPMPEVIGIDHIYISVSDLARSEAFYDRVMPILGFRKNAFAIGSDSQVQYFNRHFGYVLRPARSKHAHDPYAPGLHHLCFRVECTADVEEAAGKLRAGGSTHPGQRFSGNTPTTITRRFSPTLMACGWK